MTTDRFTVLVHEDLQKRVQNLKKGAGSQQQMYRCIKRAATELLPEHALIESHLLTGPLRGVVYRSKQGRLRLFYTVSTSKKLVILLDVGLRKDGDKNDAYEVVKRRIRHGDFDEQFRECGHERPKV